jgi:hypothetical protein
VPYGLFISPSRSVTSQDPAEPTVPHGRHSGLGEHERGAQVHRQHLIEGGGGGDVLQRLDVAQPGIADQHVRRAQRFGGRLDEPTGGLRAAQVSADRERRAACRGDLRRQCPGGLSVGAGAEPRRCPAGGKPAGQGLPASRRRRGRSARISVGWLLVGGCFN